MMATLFAPLASRLSLVTAPAAMVQLVEPWSRLYADSKVIATAVVFGHIAALLFAGGLAVTLDRSTLRAARTPELRERHLAELARSHPMVISGLSLSAVTGLLLFTSDLETYFVSWVFWTKMLLIATLLTNGYRMTRAEASLGGATDNADHAWRRLRFAALASLVLWFAIALAGVALVKAA